MKIEELVWDEWNEDHIARHGISQREVEEAVFDKASVFFRTRSAEARRYAALGLSEAGRYLFIVLEPQAGNKAYVVTARDMTDAEKRRYKSR